MRYFLLIGGFWGFILVLASSLYAGNRLAPALRDASLGCVALAVLFKFLHAAIISGVRYHLHQRGKFVADIEGEGPERSTRG